jgi:hypothetical protein
VLGRFTVALALLALAGCGTGNDERAARGAVERFESAVAARDGAGACEELSEDTSSKLEGSEQKPCEQAILSLELPPTREVVDASVWVTGAQLKLDGDTLFLDETSQGWKISAAGCKPGSAGEPYDCELEG